jgi:hypothetical protein
VIENVEDLRPELQNKSFSANWICRELVAVAVIVPAEGL